MQLFTPEDAAQIDCTSEAATRQSEVKPVEVDPSNPLGGLSQRQREVLTCIFAGKGSMRELSYLLGLNPKTASAHKRAAMDKLRLSNDAALTRFGLRYGLLEA